MPEPVPARPWRALAAGVAALLLLSACGKMEESRSCTLTLGGEALRAELVMSRNYLVFFNAGNRWTVTVTRDGRQEFRQSWRLGAERAGQMGRVFGCRWDGTERVEITAGIRLPQGRGDLPPVFHLERGPDGWRIGPGTAL